MEHGRDSATSCDHSHAVYLSLNHLLCLFVANHEIGVAIVVHIASDRGEFQLFVTQRHPIDELSECATSLVFEIAQVDFD